MRRNRLVGGYITMKNKIGLIIVLAILGALVIGCSSINPFSEKKTGSASNASNKTLTDKAVDTAVGEQKIGVPECDEVMDMLAAEANNPDDNFVSKAIKATFLNKIKESIKKSVEENKTDKAEMAKNCREFKTELEKFKAEEKKKAEK